MNCLSKSERRNFFSKSSQQEIYLAIFSHPAITAEEITLILQLTLKGLAWILERVWWWKRRNLQQTHTVEKTQTYTAAGVTLVPILQVTHSLSRGMPFLSPSLRRVIL